MRRLPLVLTALLTTMILLAGCSNSPGGGGGEKRPGSAAVVVVSGGDATSPFTTPDAACATGLAAGNTSTAIREFLLSKKYTVYTSPAMAGRGQVTDQTGLAHSVSARSPCRRT